MWQKIVAFKYSWHILDCISKSGDSRKKKPFALEMASCSQRVFWHKKQNFAKCEQGLREHVYASESIIKGRQADFWEGGGGGGRWFQNILQTDSEEKKIVARKIMPGEKNFLYWKISFMAYNAGKNLTLLYVRKRNYINLHKTNHLYPHLRKVKWSAS